MIELSSAQVASASDVVSQRRKAAMIVQMVLSDGSKLSLSLLPENLQALLTRELGALRMVDRTTLNAVATEFAQDLESVALMSTGGIEGALHALAGQISPATAARLRDEAAHAKGGDPWMQISARTPLDLVPLMETEGYEVCAVALSKLPVAKAAELLGLLTGERARRISYAMSQTAGISPDAVLRIGQALAGEYCNGLIAAFDHPPVQRIGAILNASPAITRDSVLDGLGGDDPAFAEQVRRAIFTFADIPERIAPLDIPKVIRGVEGTVLVTALAAGIADGGTAAETTEFILKSISQRMADQLREDISERGKVRKSDGEAAQAALIITIRARIDAGEVKLIEHEEHDD